jgi:hypothetical protein
MPATGPRTIEGKLVVSRNGVQHGLRTAAIVLPNVESEDEWRAFSEAVVHDLAPDGLVETALAHRVAELMWRLRRVARAERDAVHDIHEREEQSERHRAAEYERLKAQLHSAFVPRAVPLPSLPPAEKTLAPISRYEAHLNRQLYQALHELEARKDRRSGQPAPLARVQVHGLPGGA